MLRNLIRTRNLIALLLPLALGGVALAGGVDCPHMKGAAAAAGMEKGAGCGLNKGVTKTTTMTDDGAVVMLTGKTDKAVESIKTHLGEHDKGEGCKDCIFSKEGVATSVKLNDKGGEVTLKGSTPEAIKAIKDWAGDPKASCCGMHDHKTV